MWQGGNQLVSITDGSNTYSYTYNSDGLRTSKTVNGVTTEYYWVDNVLTAQVCGDNVMLFRYDAEGNPLSFNYNGTEYFYVLNTQGDVSALMDISGMTIAFYYYDAWGNIVSVQDYAGNEITSESHIAHINPIRYRGYYYDTEIEMYYLQSRYYSPELCRFISSDEIDFLGASGSVLSYNLFSYCENNTIMNNDSSGCGVLLAYGVQICASFLGMTVGIEFLWRHSDGSFNIFVFVGGTAGKTFKGKLKNIEDMFMQKISGIFKNASKIGSKLITKLGRLGLSLSAIAVMGNKHVVFPRDYWGEFIGGSFSLFHLVISGAIAKNGKKTIGSVGLGITTSKGNISLSYTYYFQCTFNKKIWKEQFSELKKYIKNKTSSLKILANRF